MEERDSQCMVGRGEEEGEDGEDECEMGVVNGCVCVERGFVVVSMMARERVELCMMN